VAGPRGLASAWQWSSYDTHRRWSDKALPLGSVDYDPELDAKGERLIWVEAAIVDRLRAMRGAGESYSDVILRLIEPEAQVTAYPFVNHVAPPSSQQCLMGEWQWLL